MADGAGGPEGKRVREGSDGRRLAWAAVGVVVFTVAYPIAKQVFGF